MVTQVAGGNEGSNVTRDEPVASNCRVGTGDEYAGGERVQGVMWCAAMAIGHGFGGGW